MDFKRLIYKYDNATNTTSISKTKVISLVVFFIFFFWDLLSIISDPKPGSNVILGPILMGLIVATPVFIVGFIISKIINRGKKENKSPTIQNNVQTPETTTIKKENENLVLNDVGSDEAIEELPTMDELNTEQYPTLVGVVCPKCGSNSYDIKGIKGAEFKAVANNLTYSGTSMLRITGRVMKISLNDDGSNLKPISFQCLNCKEKFNALPNVAPSSEILEKPYEITLKRLPNAKSIVDHHVYLNGIMVGPVKNDEEITFYTQTKTNVLFVTDRHGITLINKHGDLFKNHYRFIAQSGGSQRIFHKSSILNR